MEKIKILAIGASPHKGNTYSTLNSIPDIYPHIDYKVLMLNEVNLEMCRGCYNCVRLGEEKCPLKDDRDIIIKEIESADGIIFASPVYVNQATALMKNFMERLGYNAHRPRYYDKFAMVMAVCGMFGAKEVNKVMSDIFTSFGFNVVSSLELEISTKTKKEKEYNQTKITKAFNTLISRIEKGKRNKPTIGEVVRFNLFKSLSEMLKGYFVADYEYYKDKPEFPYKINSFKKMVAKKTVKKMLNDYTEVHI